MRHTDYLKGVPGSCIFEHNLDCVCELVDEETEIWGAAGRLERHTTCSEHRVAIWSMGCAYAGMQCSCLSRSMEEGQLQVLEQSAKFRRPDVQVSGLRIYVLTPFERGQHGVLIFAQVFRQ